MHIISNYIVNQPSITFAWFILNTFIVEPMASWLDGMAMSLC